MNTFNNYLLTVARESRGISQTELSKQIKLDQAHLSRIEQGTIVNPSTEIVKSIAEVLKFPESFFYQSESRTPINNFFYRRRITMPAKEKNKLEARIEILRLIFDKLTKSVEIPDLNIPNISANANFSPQDIALLTREFFKIHKGPVSNIINLLEKHGISVIYISVESQKFDGITVYTEKNHPIIFLNKNMPNDRKRFTLAHELGHQVIHLPFMFENELYDRVRNNPDSLEEEANLFASEFLVPAGEVVNELIGLTYSALSQLKLYWNVSKRFLVYKARQIGAIREDKYKGLMIELSRRGERIKESFDVEIDEPKVFNQLIRVHQKTLGYSFPELCKLVNLNESDLKSFVTDNGDSKLRIAI